MNTEKMKLEMQKKNFGTKKVNKISSNLPVIKSVCEQHQFEYYGFPIASKRCKICGYEKM